MQAVQGVVGAEQGQMLEQPLNVRCQMKMPPAVGRQAQSQPRQHGQGVVVVVVVVLQSQVVVVVGPPVVVVEEVVEVVVDVVVVVVVQETSGSASSVVQ